MRISQTKVKSGLYHDEGMRRARKIGSVQNQFGGFRTLHENVLCLSSPSGGIDYLRVLQVEGVSYDLKSEEEQQLLTDLYQAFLCALPYPIQILWRVQPLDVTEYLAQFAVSCEASIEQEQVIRQALADSHHSFLEQLATQRTLLDRKMYLVVRVSQSLGEAVSPWQRLFSQKQQPKEVEKERQERLIQELDLRCREVTRLLTNMHLSVRQLKGEQELIPFYAACFLSKKMMQCPLTPEMIDGLKRPGTSLDDLLTPSAVVEMADGLWVEDEYVRAVIVSHLPRVVSPGWLKPLAAFHEPLDVSFHLHPLSSASMVSQLRRRQMEYQSSRLLAQRKGNDVDPDVKIAEADVERLIDRLASGEERMLHLSMQLLVRGSSQQEVEARVENVLAVLQNMLVRARVPLFEQAKAFRSCLPYASNDLGQHLLLDSQSASTMFPFLAHSLFHPHGVLEGITPQGDPVILDPWCDEMANANRIVLGPPGWGKSHHVKTSILRTALKYASVHEKTQQQVFQMLIIDPEREYGRITTALGGQVVRLAPGSRHHLNPFDLPKPRDASLHEHGDVLADHVQKLHSLLGIMLADRTSDQMGILQSQEKGLVDRALYETYRKMGISSDVKTHDRPAPLMRDLYDVLESGLCGPDPSGVTQRLRRYVHGSLAGVFAGPTNVHLENNVIVFDIHDMETELRAIGLFLVSHFVWTHCFHSAIPRQLIVDEAATLYQHESGALFLEDLVRRARKHYLGVTIISQHPGIFRESAIPANCATHVLMRQDATTLELMERMFKLSSREMQLLRRLGVGEALLTTGEKRLHVCFQASEVEHILATTNPREVALWKDDPKYQQMRIDFEHLLASGTSNGGHHSPLSSQNDGDVQ